MKIHSELRVLPTVTVLNRQNGQPQKLDSKQNQFAEKFNNRKCTSSKILRNYEDVHFNYLNRVWSPPFMNMDK